MLYGRWNLLLYLVYFPLFSRRHILDNRVQPIHVRERRHNIGRLINTYCHIRHTLLYLFDLYPKLLVTLFEDSVCVQILSHNALIFEDT